MTTEERLENLERALARAQQHNRRVLIVVTLAALAIITLSLLAFSTDQATSKASADTRPNLRAYRLVLVDENGDALNSEGLVTGSEGPWLGVSDSKYGLRAVLSATKDDLCLIFLDRNPRNRLRVIETEPGVNERGEAFWTAPSR